MTSRFEYNPPLTSGIFAKKELLGDPTPRPETTENQSFINELIEKKPEIKGSGDRETNKNFPGFGPGQGEPSMGDKGGFSTISGLGMDKMFQNILNMGGLGSRLGKNKRMTRKVIFKKKKREGEEERHIEEEEEENKKDEEDGEANPLEDSPAGGEEGKVNDPEYQELEIEKEDENNDPAKDEKKQMNQRKNFQEQADNRDTTNDEPTYQKMIEIEEENIRFSIDLKEWVGQDLGEGHNFNDDEVKIESDFDKQLKRLSKEKREKVKTYQTDIDLMKEQIR